MIEIVKAVCTLLAIFALAAPGFAETTIEASSSSNWTGNYAPCNNHAELLGAGPLNIGVRFSSHNADLTHEFQNALDFWSSVLDLEWHSVDSEDCAMQLLDGTPQLFNWCACTSARSQLPDKADFEGWVAFNPRLKLSKQEMFLDSVHEIGHLLGLAHNSSETSIMFFFGLDKLEWLEPSDLSALSARHSLRPGFVRDHGFSKLPVVVPTRTSHNRLNSAAAFLEVTH